MNISPLSLDHYHLTELTIEPEIGYSQDESFYPDFSNANLRSRVGVGSPIEGDSNHFALKLHLEIVSKSGGQFPYNIEICIEGFFSVVNENILKNPEASVLVNGASMLYGALRELLLLMTSRFEYGSLMLPTVNFLDLIEEKETTSENIQAKK